MDAKQSQPAETVSSGDWICRKIINTLDRIDWWSYRLAYFDNRLGNGRTIRAAWYMSRHWADHVMSQRHIGQADGRADK